MNERLRTFESEYLAKILEKYSSNFLKIKESNFDGNQSKFKPSVSVIQKFATTNSENSESKRKRKSFLADNFCVTLLKILGSEFCYFKQWSCDILDCYCRSPENIYEVIAKFEA